MSSSTMSCSVNASGCVDRSLAQGLRAGVPIVGQIPRFGLGRWPEWPRTQHPVQVSEAESRVWEFRKKIFRRCSAVPTSRFEVLQKNKVRGCDSATSNLKTAVVMEKLQLPSTDLNVAVLRELRTRAGDRRLEGWVLDKRKAYRQLPILPEHRKFSVVCLIPDDDRPKYFVMIGHSFGLVSAVYTTTTADRLL